MQKVGRAICSPLSLMWGGNMMQQITCIDDKKLESKILKAKNMDLLIRRYRIPERLLRKHKHLFNNHWWAISFEQRLSEEFIEEYKDLLNWGFVSQKQKLSEDFVERNPDLWKFLFDGPIEICQQFSESFWERHSDKVSWDYVMLNQKVSYEFVARHVGKFNPNYLRRNKKINQEDFEPIYVACELLKSYQ
jgi:hypothetical protein